MEKHSEIFVGLDVAKARHAAAVAEDGRHGDVRYLGEIDAEADSVRRFQDRRPALVELGEVARTSRRADTEIYAVDTGRLPATTRSLKSIT